MTTISWQDFQKIDLRVGTVVRVEDFKEARKPSLKVWVDFGEEVGVRKTSAQIAAHYSAEMLMGKQVVGVVNFPEKQIGPFISEFLLSGFADGDGNVVVAQPERAVPNGAKLF
jgi:tRNA-binding protein